MTPATAPTAPRVSLVIALAATLAATWTHAQSPRPSTARPGSISVVTPEPPPVLRVRGGVFVMGLDPAGLDHAVTLCAREAERFASMRGGLPADPGVVHGFLDLLLLCGGRERRRDVDLGVACSAEEFSAEVIAHEVWLSTFGLDRTEVTVAAYDRCVRAGPCAPPLDAPGTPQTGGATQPVTGVGWDDAVAYCAWAGGRLPTEAEWERAARGRDGRPFPWGWIADPGRFNHGAVEPGCDDDADGFTLAAPVGSFPAGASPDGALDLAGNVLEWVADRAAPDGAGYDHARVVNPRGPPEGSDRVVRGGAFDLPMHLARTTTRMRRPRDAHLRDLGFRCAYDRR